MPCRELDPVAPGPLSPLGCAMHRHGPRAKEGGGADGWNTSIDMGEEKLQVIKSREET